MSDSKHVTSDVNDRALVPTSLDYKLKVSTASRYRYVRVPYVTPNIADITLDPNAITQVAFDIPSQAIYNLSKSRLRFRLSFPPDANDSNKIFVHVPPINALRLVDVKGNQLLSIPFFQPYWLATRAAYPMEKYLSHGSITLGTGADANVDVARTNARASADANGSVCRFHNPAGIDTEAAPAANVANHLRVNNAGAFVAQLGGGGNSQILFLTGDVGANGSANAINCMISFDQIVHTILACNQNIYFGETVRLEIDFAPAISLGAVTDVVATFATSANFAGDVRLDRCVLEMAKEHNNVLINEMHARLTSGPLKMLTPTVSVGSQGVVAGDVQAQYNISPTNLNLLRVYTLEFIANALPADSILRWNAFNLGGVKVTQFQHLMGGTPLEQYLLQCAIGEHYREYEPLIKGSSMAIPQDYHTLAPFGLVDFTGDELCKGAVNDFQTVRGIGVAGLGDNKIVKAMTTAVALTAFGIIVGQQAFNVTKAGLEMLPGDASSVSAIPPPQN